MIPKILSTTATFNAVRYNTNKMATGKGELIDIKNFAVLKPETMTPADVKNYLKSYSEANKRVKNPQFHASISCKGREYSSEDLRKVGNSFMEKMGYGKQPYIIVFHNDTDNNHIHIVSTRVDANGKKIDDSFEHIRAQKATQEVMKELFGKDATKELKELLNYKFETKNQMISLLKLNHYQVSEKENQVQIFRAGIAYKSVKLDKLQYKSASKKTIDKIREAVQKELSADKKLLPVFNGKNEIVNYRSDFTDALKAKNIDIAFHFTGSKKPFGYTVIDNNSKQIVKGGSIFKLGELVEFTEEPDRKQKKDSGSYISQKYNVDSPMIRRMLSEYLSIDINSIRENRKKIPDADLEKYRSLLNSCKTVSDINNLNKLDAYNLYRFENNVFLISDNKHTIEVKELLDDKELLKNYLLNEGIESSSIKEQKLVKDKNSELELEDNAPELDIDEEMDSSADVWIDVTKGITSAIASQGSAEPEKKKKKKTK